MRATRRGARVGDQRAAAVGARAVEQRRGPRRGRRRRRRAGARRARRRARARSRARPRARRPARGACPGAAAWRAQELVGRRQLGADARRPRGGRPRRRARRPGARSAPTSLASSASASAARRSCDRGAELGDPRRRRRRAARRARPARARAPSARSASSSSSSASSASMRSRPASSGVSSRRLRAQALELAPAALDALGRAPPPSRACAPGAARRARPPSARRRARRASASRSSVRRASASSAASRRRATSASSACASSRAARAAAAALSAAPSSARRARTASRASSQRASTVWRSRRSCSSAASAWRLSGRSRERASRSTSSARSRLSCVRSSLSCARRRRLRCLPSPAASSISSRRSRGLEVTIASTRPWETTECISLPRPVSESTSSTSTSRQRAPLRRYSPSPLRSSRRRIEISPSGRSMAPSELSSTISTSAAERACTPWPPPKITSCIDWPRTASGDCSPIAHSTASVTLDLPEPLGPTMTDTPGANSSRVRSGNDLKPFRVIDFRCISPRTRPRRRTSSISSAVARGLLLGVLLRAPGPVADRALADRGEHLEGAVVRRARLGGHLVG